MRGLAHALSASENYVRMFEIIREIADLPTTMPNSEASKTMAVEKGFVMMAGIFMAGATWKEV
jgi:hypothetical protein